MTLDVGGSKYPYNRGWWRGVALVAVVIGGSTLLYACAAGGASPGSQDAGLSRNSGPDPAHLVWDNYGGGADASKYVALTQITKENVRNLRVAWEYETQDMASYPFNPVIDADGVMYVLAKNRSLVALNAASGEEIWVHARLGNIPARGINFWQSPDGSDKRLLFVNNNYLQAIDARTGKSILNFGNNGLVDLKVGVAPLAPEQVGGIQSSTPGVVYDDIIVLGSAPGENFLNAPGHIRAYNVRTGANVWTFHTVPQPGEFGYDTWPRDAYKYIGGTNVWGEFSVDVARGIVYAPTGSPNQDFYGADRLGNNLFANSLLALDARTGRRLWHFQTTHHDLRDFDLNSAPQLMTVNHNGQRVDAVAIATKMGMVFAFNRVTGEPLWPIEERPVPQSRVPGDRSSPTQPFQPQLPPFSRQSMTSADVNPFMAPAAKATLAARIDSLVANGRMGLYVPLDHESATLAIPGTIGGANYGHTAADPVRGMMYIISNDGFSIYNALVPFDAPDPNAPPAPPAAPPGGAGGAPGGRGGGAGVTVAEAAQGQTLYQQNCQVCHQANRSGMGAAPSLLGLETRMSGADFNSFVKAGRGEMPSFANLSDESIQAVYRFLGGAVDGGVIPLPQGRVVASGGAPGGQLPRAGGGGGGGRGFGTPYPQGVNAPNVRYSFQGNYGMQYGNISPPWSSIVAYDLNTGTLKWKRGLGTDRTAAEAGLKDTGVVETTHNGMVVTATGLIFSNAKDGTIYAYDADTGAELWAFQLPGNIGTEGIPAMYQANGKQYLVVSVTAANHRGLREPLAAGVTIPRRYVAFALP